MSDPRQDREPGKGAEREEAERSSPGAEREEDDLLNVSELIGAFLREPSLWPVLTVALGTGGSFGAALLVLAGFDRNPFAIAALVLIVGMTGDVFYRASREESFRNGARLVGLLWVFAIALAALAVWTGIATSR